jgi:hypothetical protein
MESTMSKELNDLTLVSSPLRGCLFYKNQIKMSYERLHNNEDQQHGDVAIAVELTDIQ